MPMSGSVDIVLKLELSLVKLLDNEFSFILGNGKEAKLVDGISNNSVNQAVS